MITSETKKEVEKVLAKAKFAENPAGAIHDEVLSVKDSIHKMSTIESPEVEDFLANFAKEVKGEKGDKGDTPEKGVDYFTQEDLDSIKDQITPVKGTDYVDGKDGSDGKDGRDGKDGKDGESIEGPAGPAGNNGKDGKDGKDATPDEVIAVIKKQKLDISDLSNYQQFLPKRGSDYKLNDQRWGGHGGSGTGSGTVTSVSVVTANGLSGSVATATTTPAITLDVSALSAAKIANGTVSNTEFQYLDGVTSAIQTQIDSKGSGTVTAVSIASANGFSGSSSGGATPALTIVAGAITPTTVNGLTIGTTTGTLNITNGKTVAVSNSLTLAGTDSTVMTFPSTSATIARVDAGNTFIGASTASAWVLTAPTITTSVVPTSNDGAPLGDTTHQFSDLFLAEGGVINWDNGDATITQVGDVVTVAGADMKISSPGNAATSVVTTDGSQSLTNKTYNGNTFTAGTGVLTIAASKTLTVNNTLTLAGTDSTVMTFPSTSATIARTDAANTFTGIQTITSITLPDQGQIKLTVPTTDLKATGPTCGDFNSGYSSSAIGDLVYLDSSATWQKTDANTLALYNGLLGIALEVKASGNALLVALPGSFIYSTTGFPTFTIGSPIYMSETAGAVTQTAPTTTDAATRVIGWGVHADKMYFYPSQDTSTHT